MKPRRRTILKVLCLLAAGATLNVAVAWGLALLLNPLDEKYMKVGVSRLDSNEGDQWWFVTSLSRTGHHIVTSSTMDEDMGVISSVEDVLPPGLMLTPQTESNQEDGWLIACGWPYVSMSCHFKKPPGLDNDHFEGAITLGLPVRRYAWIDVPQVLPCIPIWPGFAINTLFYAGVLWVLFAGPFALRRWIRRRRGRCSACNYPIGQSPVCTECGAAVTAKAANA